MEFSWAANVAACVALGVAFVQTGSFFATDATRAKLGHVAARRSGIIRTWGMK